ncbi:Crp/Fnr family transcriptional regulator [Streptosporangium oxazolinicum]|uniref:Crp/Fnr family transcriptional regulator n=1 Tax=Streptosporangium oxazolinicum TaxID=909287 RepID=A0ABP8BJ95_9ACTN
MSSRTPRQNPRSPWPAGTLISALDDRGRNELFGLGESQRHEPGAILIRQGDLRCDHVLLLRSVRPSSPACAKITATLDNGAEALLGIRLSGDLVGEMAALRETERSATVTACTPLVAFRIPTTTFFAHLDERPRLWSALASMIAERLEWANQRRLEFTAFEVPVRLARVLGELAARHGFAVAGGTDLGIRLSQPELGRLIGAKEAAVNNAVRLLKRNGLLLTDYRQVVITDLEALHAFGTAS